MAEPVEVDFRAKQYWKREYAHMSEMHQKVTREMLAMWECANQAIVEMSRAQSESQRLSIAKTALDKIAADSYLSA